MSGKIILLNGASSAGKSTLAAGLQARLDEPVWHFSIDHLFAANVLPWSRVKGGDFAWNDLRPAFFDGFHRCLPALALAGNNLIVEHIVETEDWMARLLRLLKGLDVFFVGVHCPRPELERRELARGDRPVGDARKDFETAHLYAAYDFEVDSTHFLDDNVAALLQAWRARTGPGAFAKMAERIPA